MKAVKLGIGSALTASACCLGPAVLATVGLGGLGLAVFFARYSALLVGIALALLLAGWWLYLSEAKRCAKEQCRMPGGKATLLTLSVASVVVVGFAWMHLGPLVSKAACAISCGRQP